MRDCHRAAMRLVIARQPRPNRRRQSERDLQVALLQRPTVLGIEPLQHCEDHAGRKSTDHQRIDRHRHKVAPQVYRRASELARHIVMALAARGCALAQAFLPHLLLHVRSCRRHAASSGWAAKMSSDHGELTGPFASGPAECANFAHLLHGASK